MLQAVLPQAPCRATAALPLDSFAKLRRKMLLDCCKWDSQIGDHCCLAGFSLVINRQTWRQLSAWALLLAQEMEAAEAELLRRPELWPALGMPRKLRTVLAQGGALTPGGARSMRFDFHPTCSGWCVSEVNSDVPGGYTESSSLPLLMAAELGEEARPAGNPAEVWARCMTRMAKGGHVALVCAPGLIDDLQILAYLARQLRAEGCIATVASLAQLQWKDGAAHLEADGKCLPIDGIFRFYQAEWLAGLPRRSGWQFLLAGGRVPVSNPPSCVLTESKGFPLIWDKLGASLETWRRLLPETRNLPDVDWRNGECWVLKEKYSNNGDSVGIRGAQPVAAWERIERHARWFPDAWVAQDRFETVAIDTPLGSLRPCLGVYVIDGRVAGVYGRMSQGQLVDFAALDVAVLVEGADDDA